MELASVQTVVRILNKQFGGKVVCGHGLREFAGYEIFALQWGFLIVIETELSSVSIVDLNDFRGGLQKLLGVPVSLIDDRGFQHYSKQFVMITQGGTG